MVDKIVLLLRFKSLGLHMQYKFLIEKLIIFNVKWSMLINVYVLRGYGCGEVNGALLFVFLST